MISKKYNIFPLSSRKLFGEVRKNGKSLNLKYGFAKYLNSFGTGGVSITFVISSKTIKHAVDRNKVRRRLKASLVEVYKEGFSSKKVFAMVYYVYKRPDILLYRKYKEEMHGLLNNIYCK